MPQIWLPNAFGLKPSPYVMSATHRGDMYHMRAAMAIDNGTRPVILYDCSDERGVREVIDYLAGFARKQNETAGKIVRNVFLTNWSYAILSGNGTGITFEKIESVDMVVGCTLNGQRVKKADLRQIAPAFVSEGACTVQVSRTPTPATLAKISAGMATVTTAQAEFLEKAFTGKKIFQVPATTANTRNILVLHRDSGSTRVGGPYPELDSGDALWDLVKGIDAATDGASNWKFNVIFYGAATHLVDGKQVAVKNKDVIEGHARYTIGKYWENLSSITVDGLSTREIEAYFFQWAYKQQYFSMVVGFRSGALDLFTFLGVPTVSLTLRNLVANDRHDLLAKNEFKRINVEYDQPRHKTTAWVSSRYKDVKGNEIDMLQSPYWLGVKPKGAGAATRQPVNPSATEDLEMRREGGPGGLASFDKAIFQLGLIIACEKSFALDKWVPSTASFGPVTNIIRASDVRNCYPLTADTDDKLKAWFGPLRQKDEADLKARGLRKSDLQETDNAYYQYIQDSSLGWIMYERTQLDGVEDAIYD